MYGDTSDWQADPEKNKDTDPSSEEYIFRPYGFQPGHSCEWSKLLLLIGRLTPGGAPAWVLPTAERIFDVGCEHGWDPERGGLYYAFGADGEALDKNKYYWALAEMLAAAGLLAKATGKQKYWDWYNKAWAYAVAHFIDGERGGWYPMVDPDNVRTDTHSAGAGNVGLPVKCVECISTPVTTMLGNVWHTITERPQTRLVRAGATRARPTTTRWLPATSCSAPSTPNRCMHVWVRMGRVDSIDGQCRRTVPSTRRAAVRQPANCGQCASRPVCVGD